MLKKCIVALGLLLVSMSAEAFVRLPVDGTDAFSKLASCFESEIQRQWPDVGGVKHLTSFFGIYSKDSSIVQFSIATEHDQKRTVFLLQLQTIDKSEWSYDDADGRTAYTDSTVSDIANLIGWNTQQPMGSINISACQSLISDR